MIHPDIKDGMILFSGKTREYSRLTVRYDSNKQTRSRTVFEVRETLALLGFKFEAHWNDSMAARGEVCTKQIRLSFGSLGEVDPLVQAIINNSYTNEKLVHTLKKDLW